MRQFIEFVVTNRLFTILFVFVVVLAALTNLPNLRVSQLPTIEMPTLLIDATLPGASAREIEQRVINPIEERLGALVIFVLLFLYAQVADEFLEQKVTR